MFFASTTNPYEFCDPFDFTWDQYAQKSTTAWILFLNTKRSYIWVDDVIASTGALLITHSILITRTRATPVTLCQLSGVYRMPPHARGFRFLGVYICLISTLVGQLVPSSMPDFCRSYPICVKLHLKGKRASGRFRLSVQMEFDTIGQSVETRNAA